MKIKNRIVAWLSLFAIGAAAFALIAVPVFLIKPFSPQTERDLAISFALKSWSPLLTIILAILALFVAAYIWQSSRRWYGKAFLIVPLFVIAVSVWFARQNNFEWMFNPLANSSYAKTNEADFVADDEMILAIELNGEAAAYPVRQMAYHHLVHDTVGGVPIVATY
jgi:thiol:disulfide interchange protein